MHSNNNNSSSSSGRSPPPRGNVTTTTTTPTTTTAVLSYKLLLFVIRVLWIFHSPQYAGLAQPGQSAISQWRWSFHTVRGGIDPGDNYFRPRGVGVVRVCKKL